MPTRFIPYTFEKSNNATGHFDMRPVLSYGTKIVAVVGARRIGKTHSAIHYILKRIQSEPEAMFAWLRDNDEARKKLAGNDGEKFFAFTKKMNFKNIEGKIKGETIFINNKCKGYLMPSSTFQNYKGNDYPNIKYLVFDEFIGERGRCVRGDRAWEIINTLYTIASTRNDVRIILLANALDRGDPILELLGMDKIKDFGIYVNRDKSVALHYCDNDPNFNKQRDNSVIGKLIKGTNYEDNLFHNKFNEDENEFFIKKPTKCKLFCIMHNYSDSIRLYIDKYELYVSNDFNPDTCKEFRYVNDLELINKTRGLIPKAYLEAIKKAHAEKRVHFESARIKNIFIEIIKKR